MFQNFYKEAGRAHARSLASALDYFECDPRFITFWPWYSPSSSCMESKYHYAIYQGSVALQFGIDLPGHYSILRTDASRMWNSWLTNDDFHSYFNNGI